MGLETANTAPLGRIDPSSMIAPASAVVTPSATAALADAFKSGMITANDVLDRVGEHARTKKKAELALAQHQISQLQDPALAAAEHQALLAKTAQGQLGAAQATAGMPLVQPTADLAAQKIEAEQAAVKYPAAQLFDLYAPKMGLSVPKTADGKVDYAQKAKIGAQIATWQTDRTEAKDKLSNIDTHLSADGTILTAVTKQGQPVSPEEVGKLQTQLNKPFQLLAPGQATVVPAILAPQQRAAAPVDEATANARRAQLINSGNQSAASQTNAQVMAQVVPNTPEPATRPEIAPAQPPVGTVIPGVGTSLGPKAPPAPPAPIHMTAEQQKTLSQAAFTKTQAQDVVKAFDALNKADSWLTGPVMGRLTSLAGPANWNAHYAEFERAKTAMLANLAKGIYHETGVLSDNDIKRYEKTLPTANDTPETARVKILGTQKDIFTSISSQFESMLQQGQALNPRAMAAKQAAEDALASLKTQEAPPQRGADWGPVVNIPGRPLMQKGPDGNYHPAR